MTSRRESFRDGIFAESFAPGPDSMRIGAEVEFLAYDAETNVPRPLVDGDESLVAVLRRHAARSGWHERRAYGVVPHFDIEGRATMTFEPGGQIEISTVPGSGVTAVVRALNGIVAPLRTALLDDGIRLESVGIDSWNDARSIPLQLRVDRYEGMTRYFESIGPYGIRMMRQTAAIQVSLDRGPRPAERWRLLNDLAPYLIAIFANSPHYCRAETGHRSYRAHCWRMLDSTRTGVCAPNDDPAMAYTDFALAANDIVRSAGGELCAFSEHGDEGAWRNHLTTLFPEIRPRGHYEVRSCDAIDSALYAAPLVFLAGLAYDERSAREARFLAEDSGALLRLAGEAGLRDAAIARTARDLFQLALDGARRLGSAYVGSEELDVASQFFTTYTARDRSPSDDRVLEAGVSPSTLSFPLPS